MECGLSMIVLGLIPAFRLLVCSVLFSKTRPGKGGYIPGFCLFVAFLYFIYTFRVLFQRHLSHTFYYYHYTFSSSLVRFFLLKGEGVNERKLCFSFFIPGILMLEYAKTQIGLAYSPVINVLVLLFFEHKCSSFKQLPLNSES